MADEILVTGSLTYDDSESDPDALQQAETTLTITTKVKCKNKIVVGTSQRAIPLGDVAAPGFCMFKNVGTTGVIQLRVGTGGAKFGKMNPGESCGPIRLGDDAQIPYAIADTAGSKLEYLILDS